MNKNQAMYYHNFKLAYKHLNEDLGHLTKSYLLHFIEHSIDKETFYINFKDYENLEEYDLIDSIFLLIKSNKNKLFDKTENEKEVRQKLLNLFAKFDRLLDKLIEVEQ